METIKDDKFYAKILPLFDVDPKSVNYKRVVPINKDKKDHVGLFLNEFGRHNFFMLADPKKKGDVNDKYPHIYYLSPTYQPKDFTTDQKDKYLIPSAYWEKVMDLKDWVSVLSVTVPEISNQLPVAFTPYQEPEKEKVVVAEEYNEINPDHYKSDKFESIDVVDAFFSTSFNLGNAFKYMVRCGKKPGVPAEKDLKKTIWYLFNELKQHLSAEELDKFIADEIASKHIKS
jgi:hypothetical protein